MKKVIAAILLVLAIAAAVSCAKSPSTAPAATATATPVNTPTVGPTTVIKFKQGVFPSAAYAGTSDTRVVNGAYVTDNFGSCANLEVGFDSGLAERVLLKFDTSAIPMTMTVQTATLTLNCFGTNGILGLAAYRVTKLWIEGSGLCGGLADVNSSWNYSDGPANPWTTPGVDFDASSKSQVTNVLATGAYSISLNPAMVQTWVSNPGQNYGMLIKAEDETTNYAANYDQTVSAGATAPLLTVSYY